VKDLSRFLNEISVKKLIHHHELIIEEKDTSNQFYAKPMLNNNISTLLKVNSEGQVKEIITKTDLAEIFAYHSFGYFSVSMKKRVTTAAPNEDIMILYLLMNAYKISRIVINKNYFPIGIVTHSSHDNSIPKKRGKNQLVSSINSKYENTVINDYSVTMKDLS